MYLNPIRLTSRGIITTKEQVLPALLGMPLCGQFMLINSLAIPVLMRFVRMAMLIEVANRK